MQNAGQYVPGTANVHPPQQFVPSEPSPNGGSTTSSLRQFRKRDVDKSQLEQPPKQESHVARVAPHNHYPPVSNDLYRYPPHQFSDYSPQVKYSDIADASQPNPISTSVIQKPKPKDYMEMCNVQQQHINNQQQYSPDNGQYMHRDPAQGYPSGFKPETHYLSKDQHQYQQLTHHPGQPKFNPMMAQTIRKYNPGPADNPFLNKLSKMHPSMARSIISDHHLQEPQPSYSPMDQRTMYGQQNHRYYPSSLHQPNPYAPNHNYSINPPHHYPNYPSASCSYQRPPTLTPRYSHMERSMSPTRRGYSENVHMNLPYHNMPQKMSTAHNYSPQYAGGPEYAQHYQHRRMGQELYSQSCRPTQYMQNHHQIPAQEMQELPENRISPSDSLKKFIENWAADEEPSNEINPMESSMNLRENIKVRDDAPPGTVYMINATDVQYFENNGIPIVTSDNGGIQLTSENYQYLIKNGLVDNSGMVRIIEANKEISIDSSGNPERIVNLQIMEATKSDCMMVNKPLRQSDGSMGPNGILPKADDENRRVVIHQNTIISPGNCIVSDRTPNQQPQSLAHNAAVESISISSKELVDKNCSPINLDQLDHNLGFSEPDPPEAENKTNKNSSKPVSKVDSNNAASGNAVNFKSNETSLSEDFSDDSQNKSPGSKSMPIIDLFGESQMEDNETRCDSQTDASISTDKENDSTSTDQSLKKSEKKTQSSVSEISCRESVAEEPVHDKIEAKFENEKQYQEVLPPDIAKYAVKKDNAICGSSLEPASLTNSVIVSPESSKKDGATKDNKNCLENSDSKHLNKHLNTSLVKDEKEDDANTSGCLNNDKAGLERSSLHSEGKQTGIMLKNVYAENKAKLLDQTKTPVEILPTSIERRKRIFSVDNIIHHIGNNMKRGSKELDIFCSTGTLTTFLEKEIEFSSLEQTLNNYYLKLDYSPTIQDSEAPSLDNTCVVETLISNKLVESAENVSCSQQTSTPEDTKGCERTAIESEEKLETEDSETILTMSPSEESICDTKEEIINDKLENETKNEEIKSAEDSIQMSSVPAMTPLVLEPDERSNTPSGFQYRNAIRVEETSVLLQIAGELMEINVNIVNGKKVITVVPLSESTAVDYNDNYEVSATVQDSEAVQMHDSGIEMEKIEVNENDRSEETIVDERECQKEENQKETTAMTDKDTFNVISYEEVAIQKQESKENIDQVQSILDSKVNEFDVAQKENEDKLQEKQDKKISFEPFKTDEDNIDQETQFASDCLEDTTQIDSAVHFEKSITLAEEEAKVVESLPKITTAKSPEIIDSAGLSKTSIAVSEGDDDNNAEHFVEEAIGSIEHSNTVEIYETPESLEIETNSKTVQFPTSSETSTFEVLEKIEKVEKTEDLSASSHLVDVLTSSNNIIIQQGKEDHDNSDVVQNCSPKTDLKCDEKYQEIANSYLSTEADDVQFFNEKNMNVNNEVIEEDIENDIDEEHLDYQLEDDVFISEEPSHEIIVSDPLEGVGLIEEEDKTSDSFDIPLEPVTASDEIVENSHPIFKAKLENDKIEMVINEYNKNSIEETDKVLSKDVNKELEIPISKDVIVETQSQDLEEKAGDLNPDTFNIGVTPTVKLETNKELIVKLSKPEVQILSPTSTNIEDHITTSKENVYLEPRRRSNTGVDSESTSVTITTKAAKKLYECDLQIPAVTTSGDVSTKVSKKSVKYQHDTVSSSKKERVVKDLTRSKKSTVKRSKRLNEKNQIKNEQKEMLRLLAEKRKQRKETKQKEAIRQNEVDVKQEKMEDNLNKSSVVKETKQSKQKRSTENDDEYVDFKELLRARKLKKLKMQEIKRREAKDFKIKLEEAGKNSAKDVNNLVANKKAVTVKKSVLVSSSQALENKAETKAETKAKCVGCNNSAKKSDKDDKQKSKNRRNSSESKSKDGTIAVKLKNCYSPKSELTTSASEVTDVKSNTVIALPVESKPVDVTAVKTKANVDDDQSSIKTDLQTKIKSTQILQPQTTPTIDVNIEENVATPVSNLEPNAEKDPVSRKVKSQKRVSFCDDISSSTSNNNEIYGRHIAEDIALLKMRTHPSSTAKDPRRRSKSYAGQVMVPSVSELIEENCGAVYKKKISLADYVSRKRKTSTESNGKTKLEGKEGTDKKSKLDSSARKREEFEEPLPSSYKSKEGSKSSKKTLKDVKTSFVIHSSDWEDSESPTPTTVQSNEECLIQDFSGLIKSKSKKPVIDVNELSPLETLENPKDTKLQEYKDKVDSQLSSLNIQIPKIKSQSSESKRVKLNLDPYGSPESSSLIKKFLSSEKITQSEMEKIKKIISYKRFIQHQKNARSPSKSPGSTSYESTCLAGKSPISCGSAYSDSLSDPSYESKNLVRCEADSKEKRLHLKRVNAKRKLPLDYDDESSSSVYSNQSESRHQNKVDYSVINRLGKDGLPKIIFKRNRQSNSEENQLVVELERIDNNLEMVEEKYNVTVTQMM